MEKYSKEYFSEMGRIGGKRTLKLHGKKHFKRISDIAQTLSTAKGVDKEKA